MARVNAPVYSLNGGEVGREALSRLDLERLQFAGSLYSNMMPRVVGAMTLRPGLEHITTLDIGPAMLLEYAFSGTATFIPVLSDSEMRIVQDDGLVERALVSTAITNGNFSSFTGWTDASTGTATADVADGSLRLNGKRFNRASAQQTVSVAVGDRGTEHGLRVDVIRGPVTVRVGSTSGNDDLVREATLDDGDHSLAFTPTTANIYVEIFIDYDRNAIVDRCVIDSAGPLVLTAPWSADDLSANIVRYEQSIDVLYLASGIYQQREIQRRSDTSWGIQRYKVDDGPFVLSEGDITLTPSVYSGNGTLTASQPFFKPEMIGRLFRLVQSGQTVIEVFDTDPAEGDFVRVSGVGAARNLTYSISGTWTGSVRLQQATDDGSGIPSAWTDRAVFTSTGADTFNDEEDNVIKYYRFAVEEGDIGSGLIGTSLVYAGGSQSGVVRATFFTSATEVSIEVLERLFSLNGTAEWDYSVWSDFDGWPRAVEVFGGRLYWGLIDQIYGSVPDEFKSYSDEIEGDSAAIARSVNSSSQRGILWLLGLQRLICGTDVSEISVKASSFDEPLTGSSWFPVDASTRGSAGLRAVKADKDGIFVQSSRTGVFRLSFDQQGIDYGSTDLTAMHEHICDGSPIVDIAVQRRPDTIVWFILENGEARALTYEPLESVIAWSRVVTDGDFKRVAASRGAGQDSVYFLVERDGTQRLERLADFDDCRGGDLNCLADAFARFPVSGPTTTFAVPHLDGRDVMVWVNGEAVHDQDNLYTVTDGEVVLETAIASGWVVIGLPYSGRYQSTKLAYGAQGGTALFQKKRVSQLGLYLIDTMLDGLRVGYSFESLRKLAVTKEGRPIEAGELFDEFDADLNPINSDWNTDSRICIEAKAPYPFTAAALVMDLKTNG